MVTEHVVGVRGTGMATGDLAFAFQDSLCFTADPSEANVCTVDVFADTIVYSSPAPMLNFFLGSALSGYSEGRFSMV